MGDVQVIFPSAMVVVLTDKREYLRFTGKKKTHHIRAHRPLTQSETECFRASPENFIRTCSQ